MTPPPSHSPTAAESLLSIVCPTCGATIAVDSAFLGKAAECPLCGHGFRTPAAAQAALVRPSAAPPRPQRDAIAEHGAGEVPAASGRSAAPRPRAAAWTLAEPDEHGRIVGGVDETALLKRASAERAGRRTRRNAIMLLAGGSILLAIVAVLGRKRR